MRIWDPYSSRIKAGSTASDVYEYDKILDRLRVQIRTIVRGVLGAFYGGYDSEITCRELSDAVAHEHGREILANVRYRSRAEIVEACPKNEPDLLVWLDLVELTFRYIEKGLSNLDDYLLRMHGISIARCHDEPHSSSMS
jgi:hypothetical protein